MAPDANAADAPVPILQGDFAGMVLQFRGRTGLSQRQVADRIHINVRSVQLWEAGESHPNARNLQALIGLFFNSGVFTAGLEQAEAAALWNAVEAESVRLKAFFDEGWFGSLRPALSTALPSNATPVISHRHYWGSAPDVAAFLGRETERDTLRDWLHDTRTRLVAVVGMGGIGKTLLATRAAVDVSAVFERVCWRSLRDAPPFEGWLSETMTILSPNETRTRGATGFERLLEIAQKAACLLVLDNFESVLESGSQAGRYRPGYDGYGALLEHFAHSSHQSRLIVTSRELPPELGPLKGQSAQVLVVSGLHGADSRALLQDSDLAGDESAWDELVRRYTGNPLALKLASTSIGELFGGDIAAYLADLDFGPGALFGGVRNLLDGQVQRLSALEHDVLRWFAIEREPISFSELGESLASSFSRRDIREAVEALLRRSLLERHEASDAPRFALHPVVLEYVSDRLAAEVAEEIALERLTALRARPLMKSVAEEFVRASQERVLCEPVLQRLLARIGGRSGVERQLVRLLDALRALPLDEHGYAPGNITNLLRLHRGELSGLNLSGLAVRQACLDDVDARDANLAGAHLNEAALAEPFDFTGGVAFSADGEYLAVGTTGGDVCVWRIGDRVLQALATGHTSACWAVTLSADGRRLASGGLDGTVRLWDAATGACLAIGRGHSGGVRSVALSGDGQVLASGGEDGTLRLWDGSSAAPLAIASAHAGGVSSVAACDDGRLFASCGVDGIVRLWDGRDGTSLATLAGSGGRLYAVTLTRDAELVVSAGIDGTLQVWDTASGTSRGVLRGHSGVIQGVATNRDGHIVASIGADGALGLWDAVTTTRLATWHPHPGGVRGVAVTDSGHLVASVGDDGNIRVWQASTRQVLAILRGYAGWHRDVTISVDGRCVVGAGNDGRVHVWDAATGLCALTLRGHEGGVWATALSDDARLLATSGDDGTVRLWDLPDGGSRAVLRGHQGGVWRVTMSGDGRRIASSGLDGTVRTWTADGNAVAVRQGHTGGVRALAMSADGSVLVSGGLDGVVKVWSSSAEGHPRLLVGHAGLVRAVAVSGDGSVIASAGADGTVRLWFSQAGPALVTLQGLIGLRAVGLSRDGAVLATGGDVGMLRLWSSTNGASLGGVPANTGGVWGLATDAEGHTIASGGADGVVRVWSSPALVLQGQFRADRPYERMDITGLTGVTAAQRVALRALGAVDGAVQVDSDSAIADAAPQTSRHGLRLLRPAAGA